MDQENKQSKKEAKVPKKDKKNPTLELEQKIAELTEALQRERADAENLRRRSEQERLKMAGFYKAQIIKDLLPTLDAAEKAIELSKAQQLDKAGEGMLAVLNKLKKSLQDLGLEKIKAEGEPFNENLHEAIAIEEGDGKKEIVVKEMQAGYKLGDEILRHSMVTVRR